MRRYLVVSLLIGFVVSFTMITLVSVGLYATLGEFVGNLYREMGLLTSGKTASSGLAGSRLEVVLVVIAAFGVAWCVIDIPQTGHKILVCILAAVVLLALSPTMALYGKLFEPFSSLTAVVLSAVGGALYAGTEHGKRKRLLINMLGSRISRSTFSRMMNSREPIRFEGAVNQVSVLTCRVFNHEILREQMEPREVVAMENHFLGIVTDFLLERGGYLDESSPDQVRVYFGMVQPSEDHAIDACRAALELPVRFRQLHDECETRWFHKLELGVAVSSGPMTVGVYGPPQDSQFSGIGKETDFCRRLAQANARYGSGILISADTHQLVKAEVEVRPMEMLYDPERHLMTEVYELLSLSKDFGPEEQARRDAYWEGVVLYRAGKFEESLLKFNQAQIPGKKDGSLDFFIQRSQSRLAGGIEVPEGSHEVTEQGHARLLNLM